METLKRFKVFIIFLRNLILSYKSEKRAIKIKNKSDEAIKLGYKRKNTAFKAYFCNYYRKYVYRNSFIKYCIFSIHEFYYNHKIKFSRKSCC